MLHKALSLCDIFKPLISKQHTSASPNPIFGGGGNPIILNKKQQLKKLLWNCAGFEVND